MIFISQDNYAFLKEKSKTKELKIFNKIFRFISHTDSENEFDVLSEKIKTLFDEKSKIYINYTLEQVLILIIFELMSKKENEQDTMKDYLKDILIILKQ
jgi:hypothetical protein